MNGIKIVLEKDLQFIQKAEKVAEINMLQDLIKKIDT